MTGANKPWSMITATTAKKTHNKAVKGRASSKALPIECSSVMPAAEVAKMITDKPIRPTAAKCSAKPVSYTHLRAHETDS